MRRDELSEVRPRVPKNWLADGVGHYDRMATGRGTARSPGGGVRTRGGGRPQTPPPIGLPCDDPAGQQAGEDRGKLGTSPLTCYDNRTPTGGANLNARA